jgi:hypothetical protein
MKIHILIPNKIPSSHLFSTEDVSLVFFKWKPPIFFLDSDSPFNCLNDSIKILLSYIRKFFMKKKLEKINFITNKNKSKNWDGAESKTRPSNLPDINLNQSELTRDTYLVRVNPHKSSSNSRK